MVLLSTRLSEVRAFSDFFCEFQQALRQSSSRFPRNTRMLVMCNRPSFEFRRAPAARCCPAAAVGCCSPRTRGLHSCRPSLDAALRTGGCGACRAFQELHERHITLVEGSAVSGQDLVTAG